MRGKDKNPKLDIHFLFSVFVTERATASFSGDVKISSYIFLLVQNVYCVVW
jgi:hypothetical protein